MSSFLQRKVDFVRHNEEVRELVQAFNEGTARRAPCVVGGSITNYFLNPELNTEGLEFQQFFEDIDVQIRAQLEYQKWQRFNLLCDREMGVPEDGWYLATDLQNSFDASWFGCKVIYQQGCLPDTVPMITQDPAQVYDLEDPDPLRDGLIGRSVEFFDAMVEKCPSLEYMGVPVRPPIRLLGEGTDGPFEAAVKIRGSEVMLDMLTEPDCFHALMDFITRNLINRIRTLKEYRWSRIPDSPDVGKYRQPIFYMADDSVAMLSIEHYRDYVLPYHRRIVEEFSEPGGLYMHLCGNATRLFPCIAEELGALGFDTGFPVDHGALRRALGPDVLIVGGPTVMLLKDGTPESIDAEVRRISESGALEGGKFQFIAANNLAPQTPIENTEAFWESVKRWAAFPVNAEMRS